MSAVLQLPVHHVQSPYMLKEKNAESFAPAFTAVNGRASPLSPRAAPGTTVMNGRQSPPLPPDRRSPEHSYHTASQYSTPPVSSGDSSPENENRNKRRRSISGDEIRSAVVDARQHRALPSMDRPGEHERRWTEPQQHNSYSEPRDHRPVGGMSLMATPHPNLGESSEFESPNSTEMTRNGVQVDVKKRKRQFANRTKTGCGTCRQRKKKCDEAKPDCNNCTRGGFECQGYASKVPWPKNGVAKPPPPLQAKEQMAHDPSAPYPRCQACNQIHIPHCSPTRSNSQPYADARATNGPDGARSRPIVVDEQERKPSAPNNWSNGWNEQPRVSYPEHGPPAPAQYPQTPAPTHDRTPSHDHHLPQPQGPPPSRQHNPRVYHHTPQSMSQTVSHSPAGAESHHQAPGQPRQPAMAPPTAAPPAPPQPHYVPPSRAHKTEKEKMLYGEPFLPSDEQLMDERAQCTGAVFSFNSTANASVVINRGDRERHFKRIIAAGWIHPRDVDHRPGAPSCGHVGRNVIVATPFHCDYGYNISLGDNIMFGPHCQLLDSARIAIGRNTRIGARVTISTIKTPTDLKALKGSNGTELADAVHIGENVYIGDNVTIEAGVKIGNNAVIRSGSVVSSDIAPNVVARGNPAFGS